MHPLKHITAKPSHYDEDAPHYDLFQESQTRPMNRLVERILSGLKAHTVLDLTCGTGSQVFWLARRGFDVTGSDINKPMLAVARRKAKNFRKKVQLVEGDMRTIRLGSFDAVISISNAVGHLTKSDFEKAMRNTAKNLRRGGIFIFDIFNLAYLLDGDRITKLTIDWLKREGKLTTRLVQYSTIDRSGILAGYTTISEQRGSAKPVISTNENTLQVYTTEQLKEMLARSGFRVIRQCDINGKPVHQTKTDRIFTVAEKL